jgi:uncharacterized protein (TIGR02145 family)
MATTVLGGDLVAGGKMKSTGTFEAGTSLWFFPNTGATNESGFTAVPAGYRGYNGAFDDIGYRGFWWNSSGYSASNSWDRYMSYDGSNVYRNNSNKNYGFSVRCVFDVIP